MTKVDNKRQAILEATLHLISEHGFHGTAMSKVAARAGVSAGIIYHYFKGKDDLIVELYKDIKQRSASAQLAGLDEAQPLRTQFRQLWGTMIRYFIAHPDETAFVSQFITSPYYTAEVEEAVRPYYANIVECYERATREQIIKDMPHTVFATLALDVPGSLARKQASGQLDLTEDLIDQIVESLWQAIRL